MAVYMLWEHVVRVRFSALRLKSMFFERYTGNTMIELKKFSRRIENFSCENCGNDVQGSGFTNHCPRCLWSKHVDINPGDRMELCGGMMKPISVFRKKGDYYVVQRCQICHVERNKKINESELAVFSGITK